MALHSRVDILRWTLLGALGVSLTASCSGSVESAEEGGTAGDGDGDGDSSGDGDTMGDGDGGGTPGDGDGDGAGGTPGDGDAAGGTSGDGDGAGGSGDGDGDGTGGSGDGDGDGDGVVACTNPVDLGGGFLDCDEGYTHRPTVGECSTSVPRDLQIGDPAICSLEQGCCQTDTDCTGANQYCQYSVGQVIGSWCTTGCLTDADCGEGSICQCGGPMGSCVAADCQSDADCAGGARCASFATDDGCGPWTRFSCQTAQDECASDLDCAADEECDGSGGFRQCVLQQFTCAEGRPFVVDEEIRVAPLCERIDWTEECAPDLKQLTEEQRGALARAWEKAGQMEHASIAAFARFSLQLLALGAPADLLERTNAALVDETRHAKLCFGLASVYRGRPVGPAPLNITNALGEASAEAIVSTAILEGCVGETAAALEAAEAAAECQDQYVRAVLLQVAEDETKHAELAWRFVGWIVSARPDLRRVVASRLGQLSRETSFVSGGPSRARLATFGVLDEERRVAVRREAISRVVIPCARKLLASAAFRVRKVGTPCPGERRNS